MGAPCETAFTLFPRLYGEAVAAGAIYPPVIRVPPCLPAGHFFAALSAFPAIVIPDVSRIWTSSRPLAQ